MTKMEASISTDAAMLSSRKPTQRAVAMKANHQLPLASISTRKSSRNRDCAPYARIVGRPCAGRGQI